MGRWPRGRSWDSLVLSLSTGYRTGTCWPSACWCWASSSSCSSSTPSSPASILTWVSLAAVGGFRCYTLHLTSQPEGEVSRSFSDPGDAAGPGRAEVEGVEGGQPSRERGKSFSPSLSSSLALCLKINFKKSLKKKDFIYLLLDTGKAGRERNINVWLPLAYPQLGVWPATQVCALTGNRTGNPLVLRRVLNPLSHSPGCNTSLYCSWISTPLPPRKDRKSWQQGLSLPSPLSVSDCTSVLVLRVACPRCTGGRWLSFSL